MNKKNIYIQSNDLNNMRADKFIKSLNEFAKINAVEPSEIWVETEDYSTIYAFCTRLETDEECWHRLQQEQVQKDLREKEEYRKYEELKKRFG